MASITDQTVQVNAGASRASRRIDFFFIESRELKRTIPVFDESGHLLAVLVLEPKPEPEPIPFDGRPLARARDLDAGDAVGLQRGEF